MADLPPEFKPDIVAALRLVIQAVSQIASSMPHGVPRNLLLAQNLLDPPLVAEDVPEPVAEQPVQVWSSRKPAIDKPEPDTPTP